jgi:hypothetical protein
VLLRSGNSGTARTHRANRIATSTTEKVRQSFQRFCIATHEEKLVRKKLTRCASRRTSSSSDNEEHSGKRAFTMTKQTEDKKEQRAREGAQAWAEYQAEGRAAREKTARLRALRLARDATDSNVAEPKKKKK